jgi:chromosome segregation ATPase
MRVRQLITFFPLVRTYNHPITGSQPLRRGASNSDPKDELVKIQEREISELRHLLAKGGKEYNESERKILERHLAEHQKQRVQVHQAEMANVRAELMEFINLSNKLSAQIDTLTAERSKLIKDIHFIEAYLQNLESVDSSAVADSDTGKSWFPR